MVYQIPADFDIIAEYGEMIKKGAAKYTEMGNLVAS